MVLWLIAFLAGVLLASLQYGRAAGRPRVAPLALSRALAALLIVALLLGAPAGRRAAVTPEVALDASESWTRGAPRCNQWPAALDSAARLGGRRWLRFGEALRSDASSAAPEDRASSLRAVADRAVGSGQPVVVITDGELADAELARGLPRGSRIVVLPCAGVPDVAVAALDAPASLLVGDTTTVRVTLSAGAAGGPAGRVELRLDDLVLAAADHPALAPYAEQAIALRGVAAGSERQGIIRAVVRAAGDGEARNDTLGLGVTVTRAPAAIFVSTAPDYDAREAVAALRGVTSLPTRAFYRVAAGTWRSEGTLAPVSEALVRTAVRDAPLVVLHGDTSVFGLPRAATTGALLLFAPPASDDGEWFAAAAPSSPVAAAIGALPFDSLPPLSVAPVLPRGDWQGLIVHRGGAPDDRRPALVGWNGPRRVAVLGAAGLWRWRFRGGARADAYGAFFGSVYDWLAAGRPDRRAVVPPGEPLRAGMPVRWARGAATDSIVPITITRRAATGRVLTIPLHFERDAIIAESPPLAPGVYDVRMSGGSAVLVVNASREMIPRRPTVRAGMVGGSAPLGEPPSLPELGWPYVLVVLLLCAEWIGRRREGLR